MPITNLGYKSTIGNPYGIYYLRIVDDKLIDPSGKYATYNSLLKVADNQLVMLMPGIDADGNINLNFLVGLSYLSLLGKYASGFADFWGNSMNFDSTTPDSPLTLAEEN